MVTAHSFLGLLLECAKNRWIAIVVIVPRARLPEWRSRDGNPNASALARRVNRRRDNDGPSRWNGSLSSTRSAVFPPHMLDSGPRSDFVTLAKNFHAQP
jgi:hypothetical protein